ncbi:MAG: hypothetical protein M3134_09195 [Actinomycetota bacterium]|nr:hypothetical protein [Actinomycetota bacterium]
MTQHDIELNEQGQARRRFLKQAATVAWASPFIVTMMSRAAHAQPIQCGVQDLDSLCGVGQGCGTAQVCAPGELGPGNPCFCVPA